MHNSGQPVIRKSLLLQILFQTKNEDIRTRSVKSFRDRGRAWTVCGLLDTDDCTARVSSISPNEDLWIPRSMYHRTQEAHVHV